LGAGVPSPKAIIAHGLYALIYQDASCKARTAVSISLFFGSDKALDF
jgi:hypothetical protein